MPKKTTTRSFNHSINAKQHPLMKSAFRLMGRDAYYYYFTLIEAISSESLFIYESPVSISMDSLLQYWNKSFLDTKRILIKLQNSGLLVWTFSSGEYQMVFTDLHKSLTSGGDNGIRKQKLF